MVGKLEKIMYVKHEALWPTQKSSPVNDSYYHHFHCLPQTSHPSYLVVSTVELVDKGELLDLNLFAVVFMLLGFTVFLRTLEALDIQVSKAW